MEANFKQSLAWVRVSEGGNDDDPNDSGGRTSRGITQREWDAYCKICGLPLGDVWKAPDGALDDIYHRSYWLPYSVTMPPGVDYSYFDASVLHGPVEGMMMLQRALGVTPDGHLGVITSHALSTTTDLGALIDKMAAVRSQFDRLLTIKRPKDREFLNGWLKRVEYVRTNAHTLVPKNDSGSA